MIFCWVAKKWAVFSPFALPAVAVSTRVRPLAGFVPLGAQLRAWTSLFFLEAI
jgi:hypothetical protein